MKTVTEDESEAGGIGKQEQQSMTFLRRAHKSILGKKKENSYMYTVDVFLRQKKWNYIGPYVGSHWKANKGESIGGKSLYFHSKVLIIDCFCYI